MADSGGHRCEIPRRGVRLAVFVSAPAFDRTAGADRAGVAAAGGYGGELPGGRLQPAVFVVAPAGNRPAGADAARKAETGRNVGEHHRIRRGLGFRRRGRFRIGLGFGSRRRRRRVRLAVRPDLDDKVVPAAADQAYRQAFFAAVRPAFARFVHYMDGPPRVVSVVFVEERSRSTFQAGTVSEIRAVAAEEGLVYPVYLHALFGNAAVGPIHVAPASGSRSEGPVAEPVAFLQQHDQHLGSLAADRSQRVPGGRSGVVHRYPGGGYPAGCVAVDRRGSQSGQRFGPGAVGPPHDVHGVVVLPDPPAPVGLAAVGVRPAEGVAYLVGQHRGICHGRGVDQHRPPVARKTLIGYRTAAEPAHPQQPAVVQRVEDDYQRPVRLGLVTPVAVVHRVTAALVVVEGRADADRPACAEHRTVLPARRPIEPGSHAACELGRIVGRAAPAARRCVAYPHLPSVASGPRKRIGAPEAGMGDQLQRVARIDAARVGRQRAAGGGRRGFRRGFRRRRCFGHRRLLGGRLLGGRIQGDGSVRLQAGMAQGPDDEGGHLTPGNGAVGIVGAVRPSARHAQLVYGVDRPLLGGGNHVDDVGE